MTGLTEKEKMAKSLDLAATFVVADLSLLLAVGLRRT